MRARSWRSLRAESIYTFFYLKKNPAERGSFLNKCLALTYFHMATATLSSAQSVFTSEFDMESGGTHLLLSPGKTGISTELTLLIRNLYILSVLAIRTSYIII